MAAPTFAERHVDADGFRIRYLEAGEGPPLVCTHGAGGLRLSPLYDALAAHRRVIAFEAPGFGTSPVNDRTHSMPELAATMRAAVAALGLAEADLMGTSFGGRLATWMAVQEPARWRSLVLLSPAVFLLKQRPPMNTPEERHAIFHAHPERHQPFATDPTILVKQETLVRRVMGPPRDEALEAQLGGLAVPTLVVFGTLDRLTPPEFGRLYRQLFANAHLVFLYDAAHLVDIDRPEALTPLVADFLDRREQFLVSQASGVLYP